MQGLGSREKLRVACWLALLSACATQHAGGTQQAEPKTSASHLTSGTAADAASPQPSNSVPSVASSSATELSTAEPALPDAGAAQGRDAGAEPSPSVEGPWQWDLPQGFPQPPVPEDNPLSAAKVTLGRYLFFDKRLSQNGTQSCASCHEPSKAFTDGKAVSVGSTGQLTPRGSMSLANVVYAPTLTWANPLQTSLERQALIPLFGDNPVELGNRSQAELEARISDVELYQSLFASAFPADAAPITSHNLVAAIAAFERTLLSGDSPFDRYLYGDREAISSAAKRGYQLFSSEKLECFHCHLGFNLTDHTTYADKPFIDTPYHNTGLYNIDGAGAYPEPNTGVYSVTQLPADMGRFKAPTLRNIALTAPYMHDGSIATLDEVLDHYGAGGRLIAEGPYAGDGSQSPLRSNLLIGFTLSAEERAELHAFFESLSDATFLSDPRFADPWPAEADAR